MKARSRTADAGELGSSQLQALHESLQKVLSKHGRTRANGTPLSESTIKSTAGTLATCLTRIWHLGFHINSVDQLRQTHCRALAEDWMRQGYTVNTIVNNLCRLRQLGYWIGRPSLVPIDAAANWLNTARPRPSSSTSAKGTKRG